MKDIEADPTGRPAREHPILSPAQTLASPSRSQAVSPADNHPTPRSPRDTADMGDRSPLERNPPTGCFFPDPAAAEWHPVTPLPPSLRIVPVQVNRVSGFEMTTPTLEEIREQLTQADLLMPAPPPRSVSEARWSATTHSSNFTASSRGSMVAYISQLQPPPVPRKARSKYGSGTADLAPGTSASRRVSTVEEEETTGRSVRDQEEGVRYP